MDVAPSRLMVLGGGADVQGELQFSCIYHGQDGEKDL
jgi:hypothetical protein